MKHPDFKSVISRLHGMHFYNKQTFDQFYQAKNKRNPDPVNHRRLEKSHKSIGLKHSAPKTSGIMNFNAQKPYIYIYIIKADIIVTAVMKVEER